MTKVIKAIKKNIILLALVMAGCAHTTPEDTKECCKRLSLQQQQMTQFNRYCKVALFLKKGKTNIIGKKVQENATQAVNICKFVFGVRTDDQLVEAGDLQEYYRVRSYLIMDPSDTFWRRSLDCDPAELHCEEF